MSSTTGDDIESGKEEVTYDVKEKKSVRKLFNEYKKCVIFIVCILFVIIFIILYKIIDTRNYRGNYARIMSGGGTHKLTCDDFEYGCCYLYQNCKVSSVGGVNHLDFKRIKIDPHKIISDDNLKSNCPTLESIVNGYNSHYGNQTCGEFGCCPDVDITCDETVQSYINDGNNIHLIEKYRDHIGTKMKINVPKDNPHGSNCWNNNGGIYHFKNKYENNYPSENDGNFGTIVLIILCVLALIAGARAK